VYTAAPVDKRLFGFKKEACSILALIALLPAAYSGPLIILPAEPFFPGEWLGEGKLSPPSIEEPGL